MGSEREDDGAIISFLVGMGIGAVVAAVAAVLYAPRPGADTRRSVAEAVKDLRGRAERLAERVRAAAHDVTERLKQDADVAVAAGKEAAAAKRAELERTTRGE